MELLKNTKQNGHRQVEQNKEGYTDWNNSSDLDQKIINLPKPPLKKTLSNSYKGKTGRLTDSTSAHKNSNEAPSIDDLYQDYETFKGLSQKAEQHIHDMEVQFKASKIAKISLSNGFHKVKKGLSSLHQDNRDCVNDLQKKIKKISEEKDKITNEHVKIKTKLSTELQEATNSVNDLKKKYEETLKLLEDKSNTCENQRNQIQMAEESLSFLRGEVENYKEMLNNNQGKVNEIQYIQKIKNQIEEQQHKIKKERKEINEWTNALDPFFFQNINDIVEMIIKGVEYQQRYEKLNKKSNELEEDNKKLIDQISQVQNEIESIMNQLHALAIRSDPHVTLTAPTKECFDAISDIINLQHITMEIAKSITPHLTSNATFQECVEGMKHRVDKMLKELHNYESSYSSLKHANKSIENKLQEDAQQLQRDNDLLVINNRELNSKIIELAKEGEELKKMKIYLGQRNESAEKIRNEHKYELEKEKIILEHQQLKNNLIQHYLERDQMMINLVRKNIELFVQVIEPSSMVQASLPPKAVQSIAECTKQLNQLKDFLLLSPVRFDDQQLTGSNFNDNNPLNGMSEITRSIASSSESSFAKIDISQIKLTELDKAVRSFGLQYEENLTQMKSKILQYQANQQMKYQEILNFFENHVIRDDMSNKDILKLHSEIGSLKIRLGEAFSERDRLMAEAQLQENKSNQMAYQQQETQKVMNAIIVDLQTEVTRLREELQEATHSHQYLSNPLKSKKSFEAEKSTATSSRINIEVDSKSRFLHDLASETGQSGYISPRIDNSKKFQRDFLNTSSSASPKVQSQIPKASVSENTLGSTATEEIPLDTTPKDVQMWYRGAKCIEGHTFAISIFNNPNQTVLRIEIFNSDSEANQAIFVTFKELKDFLEQEGMIIPDLKTLSIQSDKRQQVMDILLAHLHVIPNAGGKSNTIKLQIK